MFQSTRPHGARLRLNNVLALTINVSIHAPAWGATVAIIGSTQYKNVSIHAPAWGAT